MHGFGVALGSAVESCEIMADLRVLGFDGVGMRFGADMLFFRQDIIGAIIVGSIYICRQIAHEHKPFQRFATTTTDPEGHDIFEVSINSQPDPELLLFF